MSPVSMMTSMPRLLNAATASRLVGLGVSATAMTPSRDVSLAKNRGVFPCAARASVRSSQSMRSMPASSIMARLPARQVCPPSTARTPRPWTASKPSTGCWGSLRSDASSTMAAPRGCSEGASRQAASPSRAFSASPSAGRISVTWGLPWVKVPVLSRTTVLMVCRVSRASADLTRMPFSAPLPVPTIIATGVARPRAQGQEITSTATPPVRALVTLPVARSHTTAVTSAMTMTTGTKIPDTLSASLAMGALEEDASSTRRIIWARVVSSPTRRASKTKEPDLLMDAAATLSPTVLSTGRLSPVRALSSTAEAPSTMTPSTGMDCPGRTTIRSPTTTSSTGSSASTPFRITLAVLGARSMRRVMASLVLPLERVSRNLPRVMRVRIMPADSKYRSMW